MPSIPVSLELAPSELFRRLPRRAGAFLLDGGEQESWGNGEALLGWDASRIAEFRGTPSDKDPFALIEETMHAAPCAGVVCALGYDLGRWIERLGPPPRGDFELPRLFAAAHPWVLAFSYRDRTFQLRSSHLDESDLRKVAEMLRRTASRPPTQCRANAAVASVRCNISTTRYVEIVQRALEYIAAGDVYQVNLARRFLISNRALTPADLLARLLARHPAPFSACIDGGAWALVSNSPECFLRRRGDAVSTFPIKGTRARGFSPDEDKSMEAALRSSVKDGAEHLMIVDLERNDLGRVCHTGSIHVPTYARVRTLASLHHLESEVAGRLARSTSLATLLRATFPSGSITGAPKIRSMEIIDELESTPRGFYTGAIGFATRETSCFNIAIRTAMLRDDSLSFHTGGGIVADSGPQLEYDETELKARAFLQVLQAERG